MIDANRLIPFSPEDMQFSVDDLKQEIADIKAANGGVFTGQEDWDGTTLEVGIPLYGVEGIEVFKEAGGIFSNRHDRTGCNAEEAALIADKQNGNSLVSEAFRKAVAEQGGFQAVLPPPKIEREPRSENPAP